MTISFPSKSWTLKFLDRYHAILDQSHKNKYSTVVYCLSKPQKMEGRERNAMSNSTTMHGSPQDRAVLGKRPSWETSTVGLKKGQTVSKTLVSTISEWKDCMQKKLSFRCEKTCLNQIFQFAELFTTLTENHIMFVEVKLECKVLARCEEKS